MSHIVVERFALRLRGLKAFARRHWRLLSICVALVLIVLGPLSCSRALSPSRRVMLHASPEQRIPASTIARRDVGVLRVACYNIAHGRGLAKSNWDGGDKEERRDRLDAIAALLREIDADVVVLNEVDFDCSWSHGVNQAAYLAEQAGYAYRVEERNIDARLLHQVWRFGNAVLSRYPITGAECIELPGFAALETAFAGKKRAVMCDIGLGERRLRVIGAHLSPRSESLRIASAEMMIDVARASPHPVCIAGDLNATPPDAPGARLADGDRNTIAVLDATGLFQRVPPDASNADDFTYPADAPERVIDWVLLPKDATSQRYEVIDSLLSDHRPVWADIVLPSDSEAD